MDNTQILLIMVLILVVLWILCHRSQEKKPQALSKFTQTEQPIKSNQKTQTEGVSQVQIERFIKQTKEKFGKK